MEGLLVDGRFRLGERGGSGAFGTIFRGLDTRTGNAVAVKVFHRNDADYARFEREAEVLATLHHPNVVSYVGHGQLDDGGPYIAMEWLEGCDLACRLAKEGSLDHAEALRLVLRTAQGLAAAHAEGILHRDIKPSNIFLAGEAGDDVRVIDFGIAHRPGNVAKLTMTGAIVGTPAYMSPEQARGAGDLSPSADVFGLGCVLYECLTGEPPFTGDNVRVVLARILSGDLPRVSAKNRGLSPFDPLVARMLAHDPLDRYRDAAAAARAITEVLTSSPAARAAVAPVSIAARPALVRATVLVETTAMSAARARLDRFGGEVRHEDERTLVAVFELGAGDHTARRAAEYSLEMVTGEPASRAVVLSSRGLSLVDTPEAFLAHEALDGVVLADGKVFVDELTAALLGESFELAHESRGAWVTARGPRPVPSARPLVGRARELAALHGAFAEVASERCARLVLVLGEAGIGKSHLVEAATHRFAIGETRPMVLTAQADRPTSASPFEGIRALVRDRVSLRDLQGQGLSPTDVAFLSELIGVDTDHPAVVAARADPLALADAYRVAWLAFVESEAQGRPLVLLIEDLHFADAASVRLLAATLEELVDHPLLVIATARPEEAGEQLGLLTRQQSETIRLSPLRRSLAEELLRLRVEGLAPDVVERILARAGGNPLRLVDFSRQATSGAVRDDSNVEARLLRLAPSAQRVVRGASVFGVTFTVAGVIAIMEADERGIDVDDALASAVRAEVVRARVDAEPSVFIFTHGLLQEAAYGLISAADRQAAHGRAARWLTTRAGIDPSVVAWHFERAGDTTLAFEWYAAAAHAALVGGAPARALELTTKALACKPEGDDLAKLSLLHAEAAFANADLEEGRRAAEVTLQISRRGSLSWLRAAAALLNAAGQAGDNDRVQAVAELVEAETPDREGAPMTVICLCRAANQLLGAGRSARAKSLLDASWRTTTIDANAVACRSHVQASFAVVDHHYTLAIDLLQQAAHHYALGGNLRRSALLRNFDAGVRVFAGDFAGASAELDVAEPLARRTGADLFARWIRYTRAKMVALTGDAVVARRKLEDVRRELASTPRIVAGAYIYAALAALRVDDGALAESDARAALAAHPERAIRAAALGALARALVLRGQAVEAVVAAREATEIVVAAGGLAEHESVIHLGLPEALLAAGDEDGARFAVKLAADRLHQIASRFTRPADREAYLQAIDTHAKTLQLAYRLGVASEAMTPA